MMTRINQCNDDNQKAITTVLTCKSRPNKKATIHAPESREARQSLYGEQIGPVSQILEPSSEVGEGGFSGRAETGVSV